MLHTLRFFVEVEVDSMVARRDLEEQYRQRLKEFLWASDPRITQREVIYLPEMLAPRKESRAEIEASPFDGRGVLQDGSTPERMRS